MDKFFFNQENLKKIEGILAKYPKDHQASALLPVLEIAQNQCGGWLSKSAIEAVADFLSIQSIKVYEVASFYTMFNLKPIGKYHVQVCTTVPCCLVDSEKIVDSCKDFLGIKLNEITSDNKFSLKEVECLGACVNAPVVQINNQYYENLDSDKMLKILEDLSEK